MYVNPFERMKKLKEEKEKKIYEVEKEKEKYARLGAQMGFTEDKEVVPSFIRDLIGEPRKINLPPFINNEDRSSQKDSVDLNQNLNFYSNSLEEFENKQKLEDFINSNEEDMLVLDFEDLDNSLKTNDINFNKEILEFNSYTELIKTRDYINKIFILVNEKQKFEKLVDNLNYENAFNEKIVIKINKIMMYSLPCLFLFKQIINSLPKQITVEDKKVLWERTSLLLAGTEWGKTTSDIDFIIESLSLTDDPINMVIQEFKNLFFDYQFNKTIDLFILDFEKIPKEKIFLILNFLTELVVNIPNIRISLNFKEENISLLNDLDCNIENILLIEKAMEVKIVKNDFNKNYFKSDIPHVLEEENFNIESPYLEELEFLNSNYFQNQKQENKISDLNNDYGINSNLRIRVNTVLEKQRIELEEQEKSEQLNRLSQNGNSNFNPFILRKENVENNKEENVFAKFRKDNLININNKSSNTNINNKGTSISGNWSDLNK
ncbi:hypothetical protein [Spiroplasma taiwanense]|uniref:Uncharacterized protein n=1 Tax=Spiroplasma taiwanense CT-1 TaxID=1276220 RepID=S5LYK2_9MOLU|nr:hypothetical protein [Spiroplasma taiwanense]AGR41641.1 hypothetical protein STAIW_v1c10580 [Spiroplasma taiwanense CT-1]